MAQVINHPVYAKAQQRMDADSRKQQARKPAAHDNRRPASLRFMDRLTTRELKLRIALLTAMLKVPFEHESATRDNRERSLMGSRLQEYRRELEFRDMRDQQREMRPVAPARLADSVSKLKARFH